MYSNFLHANFPNAKFIYIIRDGRDVAHSIFLRTKDGPNKVVRDNVRFLKYWNMFNQEAYAACQSMGNKYCYKVRYEELVSITQPIMSHLLNFLGLNWVDDMLHHDEYIKNSKLSISKGPMFRNFPRGKINTSSIGRWKGNVPEFENRTFLEAVAPMLKVLKYLD